MEQKTKSQKQINELSPDEYYTRQSRADSLLIAAICVLGLAAIGLGLTVYLFIF